MVALLTIHLQSTETLIYKKDTGGKETTTTYTVDKTSSQYKIEATSQDHQTLLESNIPYSLVCLSCTSKKNSDHYTFTLKDSVLTADGVIKGEKLHVTHKLGKNERWIQEFEFGLLPLLTSTRKSIDFAILHPKNFKIHKMTAKKYAIETLQLGEVSYKAQQVQISLQGFKSMFWKAHLWYDTETHDLLMYKANEGPHTPTTIISLVSKASSVE